MAMKEEFGYLVENALDFLQTSVVELDAGRPKYSAIAFSSGLELMLKARIMQSDWRLCVQERDREKLSEARFRSGDFNSIGLAKARECIKTATGSALTQSESSVFTNIGRRRNQAIHFFHGDYLGENQKVAVEQLVGWTYLRRRLKNDWQDVFEPYLPKIEEIHAKMAKRADFLPAVFKGLEKSIRKEAKESPVGECFTCSYLSSIGSKATDVIRDSVCRVCDAGQRKLLLPCGQDGCDSLSERGFKKSAPCGSCGHGQECNPEESLAFLQTLYPDLKPTAWCGVCGYTPQQSVFQIEEEAVCYACHAVLPISGVGYCDHCSSFVTLEVGDYFNPGCIQCKCSHEYDDLDAVEIPTYFCSREDWLHNQRFFGLEDRFA